MSTDQNERSNDDADLFRTKLEAVQEALDKKREAVAANEQAMQNLTLSDEEIESVTINLRPASSVLLGNQTVVAIASPDFPNFDNDSSDMPSADSDPGPGPK